MKHRIGSEFNEISGRYVEFPEDEFFVPATFRQQAKVNKQGSESRKRTGIGPWQATSSCRGAVTRYKELIALGVCREQARCVLPVALYSEVYWTVSLQAVAHFIRLRADGHAQWRSSSTYRRRAGRGGTSVSGGAQGPPGLRQG